MQNILHVYPSYKLAKYFFHIDKLEMQLDFPELVSNNSNWVIALPGAEHLYSGMELMDSPVFNEKEYTEIWTYDEDGERI